VKVAGLVCQGAVSADDNTPSSDDALFLSEEVSMPAELNIDTGRSTVLQVANVGQIKTILVPAAGSETDRKVMSLALRLAQPLRAHLEFLHVRLKLEDAAAATRQTVPFLGSMEDGLNQLQCQQSNLATSATRYVQNFCREHDIPECAVPNRAAGVTASCIEETGAAIETLLFHARHSDLVILGRARHVNGMPRTLIDELLIGSGRPLLIASDDDSHDLLGTVVVGWKETPNAARAVGAALPLLQLADRVVLVNVAEDKSIGLRALDHLSAQLAWHGIAAQVQRVGKGTVPASTLLPTVAAELKAGLLVVGGFGRARLRETIFGGVTRSLVDGASLPVFMVH
jgi:nucleotide-binding universal stress UspA family protein